MSDFFSSGWSVFVAAVTIVGLIACLALLFGASRRKVMSATDNTTGHVWDGDLVELNNPLPRWWMILFIVTVVFGAIYLALYPGLGAHAGQLKWSSVGEHQADVVTAKAQVAPIYARFNGMAPDVLAKDAQAMALGERLFVNNCSQCHGSNARGSKGFPNLTDGDWLWGGTPEKISETLHLGRNGNMPPMAAAVGSAADVRNVANYVLSLSDSPHDNVAAQLGKAKFVVCAACHGPDGKGNPAIGSANLTDKTWLHGFGEEAIVRMVNEGKVNVMPSQKDRLSEDQIRVLATYVWSLSQPGSLTAAR